MKSLAISDYCTPDKYAMMTLSIPKVDEPDQLLIKVHAASINPVDVHVASGVAKKFWPQP
jgi:NADPH:quinone reductase-like Zn-dependent oxidoreductase